MSMQKSIYEYILQHIKDGEAEKGFSLPDPEGNGSIKFADGAMDGITVYHTERTPLNAAGTRLMIKALKLASADNAPEANAAFAELGKTFRAISIVDEFQSYIIKHRDKLSAGNIYDTACRLLLHSKDRESVKFGLLMLQLLVTDEDIKKVIRRLGLSDEFTVFSVRNMLMWDNANDEIFRLIKKVHGWGRIHALENLQPETPKIRRWILLHGIENDVYPGYSTLTVWNKAGVEERLSGEIDRDEFSAIGRLFAALLDEVPMGGISEIENAEDLILSYLSRADDFSLELDDYKNIFELENWASDEDTGLPAVADRCAVIITSDECRKTVEEAVKAGEGLRLAEALEIDFAEDLFRCMKEDFENNWHKCRYLIHQEGYLEPLIDLFWDKLVSYCGWREIPTADFCPSLTYARYDRLVCIVQELKEHPGCGEELITGALWSPVITSRNISLRTLTSWCRLLQKPLLEISEEMYRQVSELTEKEPDDNLKEREQMLLDGYIPPEVDETEQEDE